MLTWKPVGYLLRVQGSCFSIQKKIIIYLRLESSASNSYKITSNSQNLKPALFLHFLYTSQSVWQPLNPWKFEKASNKSSPWKSVEKFLNWLKNRPLFPYHIPKIVLKLRPKSRSKIFSKAEKNHWKGAELPSKSLGKTLNRFLENLQRTCFYKLVVDNAFIFLYFHLKFRSFVYFQI